MFVFVYYAARVGPRTSGPDSRAPNRMNLAEFNLFWKVAKICLFRFFSIRTYLPTYFINYLYLFLCARNYVPTYLSTYYLYLPAYLPTYSILPIYICTYYYVFIYLLIFSAAQVPIYFYYLSIYLFFAYPPAKFLLPPLFLLLTIHLPISPHKLTNFFCTSYLRTYLPIYLPVSPFHIHDITYLYQFLLPSIYFHIYFSPPTYATRVGPRTSGPESPSQFFLARR